MGANNEEVAVRLSAKNEGAGAIRGFKDDIKSIDDQVRRATGSTLNWGGAVRQLNRDTHGAQQSLNRMVDRGVVGLGALSAGAVTWGLRTASSFELSRSAFGAMLGDVSKGNEMFNQLQAYNREAPFDFQGIASAEQTLIQMGVSGDKALTILKGIGDVAAMTTDPTNNLMGMSLALGQISSAGKLFSQDLNQLTSNRFPAWALAAEVTGKSIGELRREMSTGASIDSAAFVSAIESMQGATLAAFKSGARKQNETLFGQWANFKDMMAFELEEGMQPALPEIKRELPIFAHSFADAIERIGPQLPELVDAAVELAPVVVDLTSAFAELVTAVAPAAEWTADKLGVRGLEALLGVAVGFRVLGGVANQVTTFAEALAVLRGVEAGGAAAGVPGGVPVPGKKGPLKAPGKFAGVGLGMGLSVLGLANLAGEKNDDGSYTSPGVHGTKYLPADAVPPAPSAASSSGDRSGRDRVASVFSGDIHIHNPHKDVDVANALEMYVRQRERRN
jgi:tape measure domain-containing protein